MPGDLDEGKAYAYAVRLLAVREYCEAQVRDRLAIWAKRREKYISDDCVDAVIKRLLQDNYLSETRFVQFFFRLRLRRGDTPRFAAIKARQKGAREDIVADNLREFEETFDASEACRALLEKRDPTGRHFDDEKIWRRQVRFLQQKGFDTATILRVMKDGARHEG